MTFDRHGFYRVGEFKTYSKLEAIELHNKTGIHPHWDFNESVFDCYDWTVEPKTSLQELYKKRAQQLRSQYDYLILNYSSGADSQTILDTFVDNDILLDETFSLINLQGTGDINNPLNDEIFQYAIPYMQSLNQTQSWPKHRVLDCTQGMVDFFSKSNSIDWVYNVNMIWTAFNVSIPDLIMSVPEWRNMMHKGIKIAIITGTDKPRLVHENGQWAARFIDISGFNGNVQMTVPDLLPYSTEYFYWTPDLPEIIIKQAHLVKNYMNSGDVKNLPHITLEKTDVAYKTVAGKKYWLNFIGLHSIIYPTWHRHQRPNACKPASMLYNVDTRSGGSGRENWFYDVGVTNEFRKRWETGYRHMWQTLPDYWKNNPLEISQGVKGSVSKNYYLEKETK